MVGALRVMCGCEGYVYIYLLLDVFLLTSVIIGSILRLQRSNAKQILSKVSFV